MVKRFFPYSIEIKPANRPANLVLAESRFVFSPKDWEPSAQSIALGKDTPDDVQPEGLGAAYALMDQNL